MKKKDVSVLIKNCQIFFFGRYDETRATLNAVYRLAVYDEILSSDQTLIKIVYINIHIEYSLLKRNS